MSSGAPLTELASLRTLFFATAGQTLGIAHRSVVSQATAFDPAFPSDAAYVENVMWTDANVTFGTLNFPGSNNDTLPWNGTFSDPVAQADEVAKRTAANIRWVNRIFAQAKANGAAGIVIGTQADMWDPAAFAVGGDGLSAYTTFVQQLAALSVEFGKPVLLVNGDSHVYEGDVRSPIRRAPRASCTPCPTAFRTSRGSPSKARPLRTSG